jgi:hypothetical protein
MRARVLVRAASLVAVALAGWSVNVRWGSGTAERGGPPIQWETSVVGAAALSALAALAVWLGTRPTAGAGRPWLRGAACVFAAGVAGIALDLRRRAAHLQVADLLEGPGWAWLATGAAVAMLAAAGSFAVRDAAPARRARKRGRR